MQFIYDQNNIAVNNIITVVYHQWIAIKTTQMKRETIGIRM